MFMPLSSFESDCPIFALTTWRNEDILKDTERYLFSIVER